MYQIEKWIIRKTLKMYVQDLIAQLTSNSIIDAAYAWVCAARINTSHNNSIWDLRFTWDALKPQLIQALRNNEYHLSPLKRYQIDNQYYDSWEAQDALILKALSLVLTKHLKQELPISCAHLKDHGGSKQTLTKTHHQLHQYNFVYKSDIKSYYKSINHEILIAKLKPYISDAIIIRLIEEYCNRLIWANGEYEVITQGISMGCPLSPLIGAWFLKDLDKALESNPNTYYVRYMDDWLVLTKTRNHLRQAIKKINQILSALKLSIHPDKTFIGWIKAGFDFLGYHLNPETIELSKTTIKRCQAKISQLYEQGASKQRLDQYWQNFVRWAKGGVARYMLRGISLTSECRERTGYCKNKKLHNLRPGLVNAITTQQSTCTGN